MRVALYLRMSTDAQDQSIQQQEKALRERCREKGYTIVRVYSDEGISGNSFAKRVGFREMLADSSKGIFERVLAWDQDRLARFDSLTAGRYLAPLRDNGIEIETIGQGEIDLSTFGGRVVFNVSQEMKHKYLHDLGHNVARGLTDKAAAGRGYVGGRNPYGYDRETRLEGRYRVSRLTVKAAEARIVKRIFETYGRPNVSLRGIAEQLNADKVQPPGRAKIWHRQCIAYILANPVYTGTLQWGARMSGEFASRGGVSRKPMQRIEYHAPIRHEDHDSVPAIIGKDLFGKVQQLLIERQSETRAKSRTRPLSGMIYCECGRKMHSEGPSYRCSSNSTPDGKRCSCRRLHEGKLLAAVASAIDAYLEARGDFRAALRRSIGKLMASPKQHAAADDLRAMRKQASALEAKLAAGAARLLEVPTGLVPELSKALEATRRERDSLAADIAAAEAAGKAKPVSIDAVVGDVLAAAKDAGEALRHADAGKLQEAFRRLQTRITVEQQDAERITCRVAFGLDRGLVGIPRKIQTSPQPVILAFRVAIEVSPSQAARRRRA